MTDGWQPEHTAPTGRWVLVRTGERKSNLTTAAKLGGMWWIPDKDYRKLIPLEQWLHTIPATDPNWTDKLSFYMPLCLPPGAPRDVFSNAPAEWCDIPDAISVRLVNRMPFGA